MPARKNHWITAIAEDVRQRAFDAVDDVAAGLKDTVPFGAAPPPKPQMTLQGFLGMPADQRQAFLQNLGPEEGPALMDRLYNDAVDQFGAMAGPILPMLTASQGQMQLEQAAMPENPTVGVMAAHQELVDLLGMDPFS